MKVCIKHFQIYSCFINQNKLDPKLTYNVNILFQIFLDYREFPCFGLAAILEVTLNYVQYLLGIKEFSPNRFYSISR